jgi:hypothetical protein
VLAVRQAAWRSGKVPAREIRAMERWWSDAWAREEQEVEGGGQERCTAPATGGTRSAEQRAETQGGRRGKNGARDRFAISEKSRDLTIKSLQLLN